MLTENNRLDCAMSAFNASSQPGTDSERLFAAMALLDGIMLTGASEKARQAVEGLRLHYNSICETYPPDSIHGDRVDLSAAHAADLLAEMNNTIHVVRDEEVDRILGRLRHHQGRLPEAEIIEVRRHQELFMPLLMKEFRDEIDKIKRSPKSDDRPTDDEYNSVPFFAFYLFSEWNIAESIPVIWECLHLPDDGPSELLGDSIHDQLPKYLAQFLSHDLDRIDAIISDPTVYTYVRWSAVSSYHYLVRDQKLTAKDAIARLESRFYATKLSDADGFPAEEHCYELSAGILDMLQKLGSSLQGITGESENWRFIETAIFHPDEAKPFTELEVQHEFDRLSPTRITDFLECIGDWATFYTPKPSRSYKSDILNSESRPKSLTSNNPFSNQILPPQSQIESGTIRREERTPRNAKCPCGSGKKYKQCCLRK